MYSYLRVCGGFKEFLFCKDKKKVLMCENVTYEESFLQVCQLAVSSKYKSSKKRSLVTEMKTRDG